MVNMTMAVPKEIHVRMKEHSEVKWAEVARKAFEEKLERLDHEEKAWKEYAQKHALKRGWSEAHELFKF